jgi:starch phosphorylase
MVYGEPDGFAEVMLHAIALNGSFFNTERMLREYVSKAYLGQRPPTPAPSATATTAT